MNKRPKSPRFRFSILAFLLIVSVLGSILGLGLRYYASEHELDRAMADLFELGANLNVSFVAQDESTNPSAVRMMVMDERTLTQKEFDHLSEIVPVLARGDRIDAIDISGTTDDPSIINALNFDNTRIEIVYKGKTVNQPNGVTK